MTTKNPLKEKSFAFAVEVVKFCKILRQKREYELASQLHRSGTSIGANFEESLRAFSRKDFAAKLSISHKEAGETDYWLRVLIECNILKDEAQKLRAPLDEIIRMLCSTIKKMNFRTDI